MRKLAGVRNSDEFVNHRYAENAKMLRQRMALLRASLRSRPVPAPGSVEAAAAADIEALLEKGETAPDWDDVQRIEILLTQLAAPAELPVAIDLHLKRLETAAPRLHEALLARWRALEAAAAARGGSVDPAAARALLVAAQEEVHWRATQTYLIRKLGVVFAARIVIAFLVTIVFGLALVVWEVYYQSTPLGDARFSGFPLALVAGLLGASFSALTSQRRVTALTNLEEVRTAIGYPMILLRLGVGVSAAAILYFFFEAGLVEGVLFPTLRDVGFDPVALAAIRAADGGVAVMSFDAVRDGVDAARGSAGEAARKLAGLLGALEDRSNAARAAASAAEDVRILGEALERAGGGLDGASTIELGRFVPNAALSKLVVWSFLAGFSEKLVPSILGRVEETARPGDGA